MEGWKINGVKIIYCSSQIPIVYYLGFISSEDSMVFLDSVNLWCPQPHINSFSSSITTTEKTPSAHHHHHLFLIPNTFVVIVILPFFSTYKLFIFFLLTFHVFIFHKKRKYNNNQISFHNSKSTIQSIC